MKKYHYKLFGFNVLSEFKLSFAETTFESEDITIAFKDPYLNHELDSMDSYGLRTKPGEAIFTAEHIAVYHMIQGRRIEITPYVNASEGDIQLFLLGTSFGLLMHQRNIFPLHGSAVAHDEGCIVVIGHSGSGKSSLASGFIDQGYRILTDDVARIIENEVGSLVCHSYPSQKLWKDTAESLQIEYDTDHQIVNVDKYHVHRPQHFETNPKCIKAIVEVVPDEVQEIKLEKLCKRVAIETLLIHSYRQEVMGPHTNTGEHLKFCARLTSHVPVYRLYRPQNQFTVLKQVEMIQDRLNIQTTTSFAGGTL